MPDKQVDWTAVSVLLVDDQDLIRVLVGSMLQMHGLRAVYQAKDGLDAMPYLTGERPAPDCVVLDINMAPVNGLELAFTIRADARVVCRSVPILFFSGNPDSTLVWAARALDVSGFIAKPASRDTILGHLARALKSPPSVGPRQAYAAREHEIFSKPYPNIRGMKHFYVGDAQAEVASLRLHEVPVGARLVESVFTPSGTVLLGRGETLTETHLERLAELFDADLARRRLRVILPGPPAHAPVRHAS